jgi:hypothetical protein
MASFKGDHNYRVYHDDLGYYYREDTESDSEEPPPRRAHSYSAWEDEHHEIIAELFDCFRRRGEAAFGRVFFQLGRYDNFARFLHEHTLGSKSDLLK